jgi:hypothetical protein
VTRKWTATGLDFEALRHAIEHRDPDAMLGFYAENARLNIVNASTPHTPPFELHGKAEIAKHLRVVFGQKTSHRVTRQIFSGDRVTFLEACDYQDGDRVWVETTLEVRGGRIVRQVDLVTWGARPDGQDGAGRGPPGHLLRSEHAPEKEDHR